MPTRNPTSIIAMTAARRSVRKPHKTRIAAAVAAALCLRYHAPVHAAGAAAASQDELETIVVTALKRRENLQDVPYNIAAVTSDDIEELHLTKIDDLSHWVAGVTVPNQGSYGASDVIMRGLAVSEIGASSGGPNGLGGAVSEYLGEIPLFYDFKLLDIDRVEVLIGPQGTLYGDGTLGGLIRYIPKRPDLSSYEVDTHVRLTTIENATPWGGYTGDAVLNLPLIADKLGFRVVVGYYDEPGFINDTRLVRNPGVSNPQPNLNDPNAVSANLYTEKGVNFDHTLVGRATLLYRPNEVFEAQLMYLHQRTTTDGPDNTNFGVPGGSGDLLGRFDSSQRNLNPAERKVDLGGLTLTGHLGFADLVSASSYAVRDFYQISDATDAYLSAPTYNAFPKFVSFFSEDLRRTEYTEELRLVSTSTSRFKWLVGAFYQHYKDKEIDVGTVPGLPAFLGIDRPDQVNFYSDGLTYFTDKAVFGEMGYQITPAWQVTVGTRWFNDTLSTRTATSSPLFDGSPPTGFNLAVQSTGPGSYTRSVYKYNTSYRFTPDVMLYATVSDGYRAGVVNQDPVCGGAVTHNCILPDQVVTKPDTTRNYELGLRSAWFDKRLTFNGDVYYIKWRDIRVSTVNQFGENYLTNGTGAVSSGVELQFQAQLPSRFQLLGTYTYTHAYMTEIAHHLISDFYGAVDAEPGDRLPGSPRNMGSLHLRRSWSFGGGYDLDASYGITAQSNVYTKIGNRLSGEQLGGYA